ncbi:hypothetical protein PVAP13_5NG238100 [Panicum virgatum]|uniref:TF-B3 domain-containing protein n=1 Tax=Panicum virgatum TaxID=38727 RepID=A0A8T0RWD2_PANVG|nr:hypothetical protein PVAP13_5NG238100 [Panicum virgatum]
MEGDGQSTAAATATKNKRKKKKNGGGCSAGASRPRAVVPFDQVPGGISDALRERLAALGATAPSYVAEKVLEMSDAHRDQARLLFSCKGEAALQRCPLTACFTEQETRFVWEEDDKHVEPGEETAGLLVTALDRGGRSYNLVCRYLTCNFSYRFITGWKKLVEDNGLSKGTRVELWEFRSPQLPNRFLQGAGRSERVPVRKESSHPDGSLGLVVLHYDDERGDGDPEHGSEEHDGGEAPPAVQETETTELQKSEEAAAPEEKLLAGGGAEPTMTGEEMVARYGLRMFLAAVGLIMLKRCHSETQSSKKREP